jgi:hypothetical protein
MARPGLSEPVLHRLLEAAGYRLSSYPAGTLAVRASDHRAVFLAAGRIAPSEVETLFPPPSVRRTLVYGEEPGPATRAQAAERGVEILDPWTLGPGLGELLLPPPAPDASGTDEAPEALDLPFPIAGPSARTVRPRVDRADVEELGAIEGARCTLRLVPHYVSAYRVRPATAHGGRGPVVRQLVAVNGTSRRAEIWEEGERELVEEVPGPYQTLTPQLAESEVAPIALDAIRRHHTVRVDHTEQHGGALVIETRRVVPDAGDVRLGPFLLVYVPHWYIEGTAGRIVLDAVSGVRKGDAGEPA